MAWILFVEDNDDLRFVIGEALSEFGPEVLSAAHGEEALELLATRASPDLIITDLHMPVMNGWELIERVRSDARLARVPIIVASSEEEQVPLTEHHLLKPYRITDLQRLIERHRARLKATGTR